MSLCAIATPIDAPMPAHRPTPSDSATLITVASMVAVFSASRSTLPALLTLLPSMKARVSVRMTLLESAPAPLTAMPAADGPMPTATDAAAAIERILAFSVALTVMPPTVVASTPKSASVAGIAASAVRPSASRM